MTRWHNVYLAVLAIAGILALQNFAFSLWDAFKYTGHDGWALVAGARLIVQGKDPYLLSSYPQRYMVPFNSPFSILLFTPLCWIPYPLQRKLWWLIEWMAFTASFFLLVRQEKNLITRKVLLVLGLVFFAASSFWRIHTELGQRYVYLLLIATLGIYFYEKNRKLSLVAFGVLCAYRPTYLVICPVLWLLRKRHDAGMIFAACLISVGLTLPVVGLHAWQRYRTVISSFEQDDLAYRFYGKASTDPESLYSAIQEKPTPVFFDGLDIAPYLGGRRFETISTTFLHIMNFRVLKSAALRWDHSIGLIRLNRILLGVAVTIYLLVCAWGARGGKYYSYQFSFLAAFTLCLVTDLFVPMRYGYADVMMLFPLALALPYLLSEKCPWPVSALALGGLCFGHSLILNSDSGSLFTLFRSPLILLSLLGVTFMTMKEQNENVS